MVDKKGMVSGRGQALTSLHLSTGSLEGQGLGTVALALGILGGLGIAALLIGAIIWQRQRRQGEER